MQRSHRIVGPCVLTALALLFACVHDHGSPARVTGLDSALHAVKTGEVSSAQAGEVVVQRTEDASVGVWRGERQAARAHREEVPDLVIATKVRRSYAATHQEDAEDIDVQVKDGVVTLSGNVGSAKAAGAAVREALDTDGVIEVRSHLDYPPSALELKKPD